MIFTQEILQVEFLDNDNEMSVEPIKGHYNPIVP